MLNEPKASKTWLFSDLAFPGKHPPREIWKQESTALDHI